MPRNADAALACLPFSMKTELPLRGAAWRGVARRRAFTGDKPGNAKMRALRNTRHAMRRIHPI
ncbi:hypothetical protein [Novosphingobium sp. ERW19]|uniref:hypothetical protein n=1 Tax=Novosphingobium sp. ERW19 TaxID=2726186 RepID=UPI0017EDE153|nr:hypothetical protein [Novosphingobium sp. ERW19]NLR39939.1 hypothetical protein [Novosphingobium sp. ERW19]